MKLPVPRRTMLQLGVAAGLARPALAQGAARTLRFVPHADMSTGDALWSTALIAFNASYMYADQLYGLNSKLLPQPQMIEGHELSDDNLAWRFKLRDGLMFHDGDRCAPRTPSPRSSAGRNVICSASAWPRSSMRWRCSMTAASGSG